MSTGAAIKKAAAASMATAGRGGANAFTPPGLPPTATKTHQAGFTLVEVLVALAVCAIALTAGSKAMQSVTRNAERQAHVMLGHLCADNALANIRISGHYPGVGDSTINCTQAGREMQVRVTVRPTPNPSFRRVDAEVFLDGHAVAQEVTVVGRY